MVVEFQGKNQILLRGEEQIAINKMLWTQCIKCIPHSQYSQVATRVFYNVCMKVTHRLEYNLVYNIIYKI